MKILNNIRKPLPLDLKSWGMLLVLAFIAPLYAQAQIIIEGNVYGGGDMGNVGGSSSVKVLSGNIGTDHLDNPGGSVFGGARMADVGGSASVFIDGENKGATDYVLINRVYGGNDIAGHIGSSESFPEGIDADGATKEGVDNSWNTFVRITNAKEDDNDIKKTYIGQLFGGGNGEYEYTKVSSTEQGEITYTHTIKEKSIDIDEEGKTLTTIVSGEPSVKPVVGKSFVDIHGGSIVYAYAGGNNATITENASICVENESNIVGHINVDDDWQLDENGTRHLITDARLEAMGINLKFSSPTAESPEDFQIGRLFGGNNLADMDIRPTWHLENGSIRNVYSGGNRGDMTHVEGLLLPIPTESTIRIDNLYGGCRMANVNPLDPVTRLPALPSQIMLTEKDENNNLKYKLPAGMSARIMIYGGDINNVYGGNDITGDVTGGNILAIYSSVRGNIYGGGNGSYAYTDNENLKNDQAYGDVYYNPDSVLAKHHIDATGMTDGIKSATALNLFRPNAEQASILIMGHPVMSTTQPGPPVLESTLPTIIGGSVYLGGNSATIHSSKTNPMVGLKLGSNAFINQVFLGNNGEEMIDQDILSTMSSVLDNSGYESSRFSKIDLTNSEMFAKYMEGAAMDMIPSLSTTSTQEGDRFEYDSYSSYIGSLYYGGNVGSMTYPGTNNINLNSEIVIFDKLVGGSNNASVPETALNAYYDGGILGADNEQDYTGDRISMTLNGIKIEPMRWNMTTPVNGEKPQYVFDAKGRPLEWNTFKWDDQENDFVETGANNIDTERRLLSGNIYGGCYESGHVNGNVKIDILKDLTVRDEVFGENENSHVILDKQGEDIMALAMTVFGAGMGKHTEIWGSTTVNLKDAYVFQIFGGGEEGVVGKGTIDMDENENPMFDDEGYPVKSYAYNQLYSTTVNLRGSNAGYSEKETGPVLAEARYLYGAGNEGDVCGDSYMYLGNGRIFDSFGGASNANVLGHTETYIGKQKDGSNVVAGFPWVTEIVFGGNDFGGTIGNNGSFSSVPGIAERINENALTDVSLLSNVSTYVDYSQGYVDSIFGGNYGNYDYLDDKYDDYVYTSGDKLGEPKEGFSYPYLNGNSLVYFQPVNNSRNSVDIILGGSEGFPGIVDINNTMQEKSYVIIDDKYTSADNKDNFSHTDIYGGGAFAGMGSIELTNNSRTLHPGAGSSVVDLLAGRFNNVYGGCVNEGMVGFTRVNVPSMSTIHVNNIFGGGRGYGDDVFNAYSSNTAATAKLKAAFCDHYITSIDYRSGNAIVDEAIYAGNSNRRIACDTYLNIAAPVKNSAGQLITVFGAGYGAETVTARTNVFLQNGAEVNQVYGGGRDGNVYNYRSLIQWLSQQYSTTDENVINAKLNEYSSYLNAFDQYIVDYSIGNNLPTDVSVHLANNNFSILRDFTSRAYYNTNVHALTGSKVLGNPRASGYGTDNGYAYGGGLGSDAVVSGSTYFELKGGYIEKDIYGGGEGGPVINKFYNNNDLFTASTNVYIEGGTVRNVYGGGYNGHVGKHTKTVGNKEVAALISDPYKNDVPGETNVVIGKIGGTSYIDGIPAIGRNVYAGGEGGSVYGTAHLTINNGYVGYLYDPDMTDDLSTIGFDERYVDNIHEYGPDDTRLLGHGNAFGGGYVASSYVDISDIEMYGGTLRGSLYGGGEVGPIGRGTKKTVTDLPEFAIQNGEATIYKAGQTHVKMFNGRVLRNVFGGGRGKDSWGNDGWMAAEVEPDLTSKGNVFGQTDVCIYGGEIGTEEGVLAGEEIGNVFGGCDRSYVYSAYELSDGTLAYGKKVGKRYDDENEGYYYKYEKTDDSYAFKTDPTTSEKLLTEDCHVLVEPWLEVTDPDGIVYDPDGEGPETAITYAKGSYIPTAYLNTLGKKNPDNGQWEDDKWAKVDVGSLSLNGEKYIERGVIIHNAVFAGGNVSSGSEVYANTPTVFGNATASIHDIYNRDLVTIGTGHTGGLYGDGNLTLVDGYRGLNITNYGTDYYNIPTEITYEDYKILPPREQNYYELKYICTATITDSEGTTYQPGAKITQDDLIALFTGTAYIENGKLTNAGRNHWTENGVVSLYAGRIMNTIQRADFCGVFGSRMVMKGAQDRAIETVDHTNYTINRVREVSLNKKISGGREHGNYFGIYSVVNYLGALTSDVDMTDIRDTKNEKTGYAADGATTFYNWKLGHLKDRKGNDGTSHNKVALASGVYLELTTEKSKGTGLYEKDWGYITGVVELDLINVSTGVGGGFVYAKNVHGQRMQSNKRNTIIEGLNTGAATNKSWVYIDQVQKENSQEFENTQAEMQTSGNFIHSKQTIIDDCYNISGKYKIGNDPVPAHYWFIKGQVYVYDQIISAYTGSPKAYPQSSDIPLTINAGAFGNMRLINIQPNRYAYYSSYADENNYVKLEGDKKLVIKDMTFSLNDPINYWDWQLLTPAEQKLFVENTYVVIEDCKIKKQDDEEKPYAAGTVLRSSDYQDLYNSNPTATHKKKVDGVEKDEPVDFTYVVRPSNNLGHDTGFLLTYDVNNPAIWDKWYTPVTGSASNKISTTRYNDSNNPVDKSQYLAGPTYKPDESNIYGQRSYQEGEIITLQEYIDYEGEDEGDDMNSNGKWDKGLKKVAEYASLLNDLNSWDEEEDEEPDTRQAEFAPAWIATEPIMTEDIDGNTRQLQKGARLAQSEFKDEQWEEIKDKVALAYVSTRPIQISATEIITDHQTMTLAEKQSHMGTTSADNKAAIYTLLNTNIENITDDRKDAIINGAALTEDEQTALGEAGISSLESLLFIHFIDQSIVPAYYCTKAGLYGGDYYDIHNNYRALYAWSSMSEDDREHFQFNYDALDLLIDPNYRNDAIASGKDDGKKYQYDGSQYEKNGGFNPDNASSADIDKMIYSMPKPVDYTATYQGTDDDAANVLFTPDGSNTQTSIATAGRNELSRTEFESILNEQIHYAPINVDVVGTYYVVNKNFVDVRPYAVGQVIDEDEYENLTSNNIVNNKTNVSKLIFDEAGSYYYCRENYQISSNGHSVKGIQANPDNHISNTVISTDGVLQTTEVPQGFIISQNNENGYKSLTNQQKDFTIHGTIPVETSTLYVSRNSDIFDLSKEKIITIIYQYDYNDFVDEEGENILPVSEYHVINIHLQFESGIPIVDDITDPATVLPGTSLTMREPTVTPGAYEVFGGGWEIFENETEAQMGINGAEYTPNSDLLYWYQNGYYIAYYAKTYLGKTYSNPKPLSVANYHDLKNIMDDKTHHLYVDYDNRKLARNSKIYINDYSRSGKNGLDLFKDFYDLSVLSSTLDKNNDLDNDGLIKSTAHEKFAGHKPLNSDPENGVIAGNNLEFFLHTNINYTADWEPIGDSECFSGTFHGDGYTISGLNNSLFSDLCGNVYNLGVTGTFTGAGIADAGSGYIENSWISTTSTAAKTTAPVFGNPSRTETQINQLGKIQIVNSYYLEDDNAKTTPASDDATHMVAYTNHPTSSEFGTAIRKPEQSFYNGEVAYDLNSSYLNKRYYDNSGASTESHDPIYGNLDYVTSRYEDGDYRYVGPYGGVIPTEPDLLHEYQENENAPIQYIPVWPDDYLFFGQNLTFGWDEDKAHQDVPSHYDGSNRVLRAPAYFGDNVMSTIHFNPDVNLAAYSKDKTKKAYPNLTAVDFAGHNDIDINNAYKQGTDAGTDRFYTPLLDLGLNNDGITSISNRDETRNLLVYAPATQYNVTVTTKNDNNETVTTTNTVNSNTYSVLKAYFMDTDGDYADYHSENDNYRRVLKVEELDIHGHMVQNDLTAIHDHLLVDKQDFNAPISYTFVDDHYMWYQRMPDSYVNSQASGWETVSLPFTVELVTTHQKGELTHFYDYSKQQNVGHEYWLREFRELDATDPSPIVQTQDNDVTLTNIYFRSLKGKSNSSKTTHNTFLWDYYYNNENNANTADRHKDKNKDDYRTYYNFGSNGKTYPSYPYQTAGMPYLIGWPGVRYYEFDLSGNFVPQNTAATSPAALDELGQVITFVSNKNVSIDVTQSEYDDYATTLSGFTFTPNYQTRTLPGATTYLLNAAGDAFQNNPGTELEPGAQTTVPFRAYLTKVVASGASMRNAKYSDANVLYIGSLNNSDYLEEKASQGGLLIYAKDMAIVVESTLAEPADVTITTVSGAPLESFTIQPGGKVTTPVNNRGVYIVNNFKLAVAK
jgi:hypothetical protein